MEQHRQPPSGDGLVGVDGALVVDGELLEARVDLDAAQAARQTAAQAHTVYLKIESSAQRSAKKVLPILKMFPGKARAVIYFADTGARMGGSCALDERMLQELREQLGEKNVVVK